MIEHSSKSKGYLPMKSGPNMMGFDMGKSGSLMEMMQVGGQPSRGAAILARSRQRRADIRELEKQQRAEAKRQKRGGLFGSIGGLAGGLLGSAALGALGASTGGLGLALAAGLGTALGRRAGEGIGAGKTRKADTEGTVFGQQSFRDLEQASRDYTRGMGERAIVSGLKSALTAGLTPGGGIFGKARDAGGGILGFSSGIAPGSSPVSASAEIAGDVAVPDFDASLPNVSNLPEPISLTERAFQESLPDAVSLGEQNELLSMAQESLATQKRMEDLSRNLGVNIARQQGLLGPSFPEMSIRRPSQSAIPIGFAQQPLLPSVGVGPISVYGSPTFGMQDGGLIEYQYGGGVGGIQGILQDAGITASPEQLALFEQFDPSSLNELASGLQSSLLSGTQQAQQQQAGMGFAGSGAIQQQQAQQRESAMGQLESAQERAARQFESQTLADLARLEEQEVEFDTFTPPPPTVSSLPTSDQGAVTFNNIEYVWDSETGQYVTRDVYEQGLADQQSGQD
jgi:hypothetical protein